MRDQIVPASGLMKTGSPAQGAILKQYFRDNVWAEKRDRVLRVGGTVQDSQSLAGVSE